MVLIVNFPPKLPHVGLYEKLETFTTDHKATSSTKISVYETAKDYI